jgi:gliding motility-associated lipoprotein GldB
MKYSFLIVLASLLALSSCSDKLAECLEAPEVAITVDVEIERLEDQLFAAESAEEVLDLINAHPTMKEEFLGAERYPSDTLMANQLFRIINNPYTDTLLMEAKAYFGEMAELEKEFEEAFSYMKHYYPNFRAPKIKTMVTGFGSAEMYVGEEEIIIGLDFYLGEEGKYRPQGIPAYILKRYDKPYIVPAVALLYADRFLQENPADQTMAADMIYYGKKYVFAKNMMPCTPDSLLIWYNGDELTNVNENKHLLWYHFLENELVYETSHITKQKYLDERPNIYEIGNKCPGRIGAWIGWDIVREYQARHPEVSLQQLLANPDAQEIFSEAKYNPF